MSIRTCLVRRTSQEGLAMVVSLDLNNEEIARLKSLTGSENDASAISAAAREYLRMIDLRQLKGASGRVDFSLNWQELEQLELQELDVPIK